MSRQEDNTEEQNIKKSTTVFDFYPAKKKWINYKKMDDQ